MQLNWVDYLCLSVLGTSTLISLSRGLVRELSSLANWIVAIWCGFVWCQPMADYLPDTIYSSSLRILLGFIIVFFLVLLAGTLLNGFLSQLVAMTGLWGTDHVLGFLFGLLRGILIITFLITIAKSTTLAEEDWWHASILIPYFEPLEYWLHSVIPYTVTDYIQSDD